MLVTERRREAYFWRPAGPHPKVCPCCRSEGTECTGTAAAMQGMCVKRIVQFALLHQRLYTLSDAQLSKEQAQEATATVDSLRASGTAFCMHMHQQLDQAMLACDALPTPHLSKSAASVAAKEFVTRLPQLLSLSRLSLTRKNT